MSREREILQALAILDHKKIGVIHLDQIKDAAMTVAERPLPENWDVVARQVLRTLTELGQVAIEGYQSIRPTSAFRNSSIYQEIGKRIGATSAQQEASGLTPNVQGPQPPDGRGPEGPSNGGGGDGGGAGFREVMAHPYLFAVSLEDFNEILIEI